MNALTMTCYKHAEYLEKVLPALAACADREAWRIFISVDVDLPSLRADPAVLALLTHWAPILCAEVTVMPWHMGCDAHVIHSLCKGFYHAQFVVHLEDDIIPAPDFLRYFAAAAEQYQGDENVWSVSAWMRTPADIGAAAVKQVYRQPWFTAQGGFGTWRDRWAEYAPACLLDPRGWDHSMNRARRDRCEIVPRVSRTQNIGDRGEHVRDPQWFHEHVSTPGGSWDYPLQAYERLEEV